MNLRLLLPSAVFRVCACIIVPAASLRAQDNPAGESRVALIMGVGDYTGTSFAKLPGIDKDLDRMKAALERTGFAVTVLQDPNLTQAEKAVDEFGAALRSKKGVGLFYFSGHGGELEGQNFLIPKGARITERGDIKLQALAAQRVLTRMESSGARVNLMFLDACRNDLTKAATDSGLAPMNVKGTFIGFATATEKLSNATTDGSPYTKVLAEMIQKPALSVSDMHTLVNARVQEETKDSPGGQQVPFQYSGLNSLFYFLPGTPGAPAVPNTAGIPNTGIPNTGIPGTPVPPNIAAPPDAEMLPDTAIAPIPPALDTPPAMDSVRREGPPVDPNTNRPFDEVPAPPATVPQGEFPKASGSITAANEWFNQGFAHYSAGRRQEAIAAYTKAIDLNPALSTAYVNRAGIYLETSNFDGIISDTNAAFQLNYERPADLYCLRGTGWAGKGDFDKALADHTKAIQLDPKHALAYNNRANDYLRKGNYAAALKDCNESIKLNPASPLPYYNRGYAYANLQNSQKAVADWVKAVQMNPAYRTELEPRIRAYGGQIPAARSTITN